jgi:DNA-binding HxlR family transcriptional regulator
LKKNDSEPIDKDQIKEACEGVFSPKDIKEGLKKLAEQGVLQEDFNPETNKKEYSIPEEPKLSPILKDLLEYKSPEKVDLDDIKEACKGLINPKKVEEDLKDLVDMGIVEEKTNPETDEKEYGLKDDEPKLLPLLKDLLKDK